MFFQYEYVLLAKKLCIAQEKEILTRSPIHFDLLTQSELGQTQVKPA